jgi:phospho-N-acetylmuramoyl-pentapeptide-transferase
MTLFTFNIIKIFFLASFSAIVSMILAPLLIRFLYKIRFWKKEARKKAISGEESSIIYSLHKEKEVSVPRGGGIIIWFSVALITFFFFFISEILPPNYSFWWLRKLNFLSRSETWLPLFTLISASIIGLFDDILQIFEKEEKNLFSSFQQKKKNLFQKILIFLGGNYIGGGMSLRRRLFFVLIIGLIGGLWFHYKLNWDTIHIPLIFNFPQGIDLYVGVFIIPLFVLTILASWSGGIIDGLDGLAGGVFASMFTAFTIIAFAEGKIELAALCATILGTIFTFLWFNVPPAKFYMGENGVLGLTSTLAVIAFLTDSLVVFPIIGGLLFLESGSVILQLLSKKFRKKKIFLAAPIHHHFEAKGWPAHQITMRFWIISFILAIIGVVIRLVALK